MIDARSPTWTAVCEVAELRIEQLRNALERDADHETTIRLRARLHAYREVLTWPEQGKSEPTEGIDLI
jgi:hypothetical protein